MRFAFREQERVFGFREGTESIGATNTLQHKTKGEVAVSRMLNLMDNLTLFSEHKAGLVKTIGQNHQLLGVDNAFASMLAARKLGTVVAACSGRRRAAARASQWWSSRRRCARCRAPASALCLEQLAGILEAA